VFFLMDTTDAEAASGPVGQEAGPAGQRLPPPSHLALVILSYPTDPNRLGDVAFIPDGTSAVLGRDAATDLKADADEIEVAFARQRPGAFRATGPLTARTLSRRQLVFRAKGDALLIENVGRAPLVLDSPDPGSAHIGCTIAIGKTLLLACTRRPERLPSLAHFPKALVPAEFGGPDAHGFAGESAYAWELRENLAEAAKRSEHDHVLLRGVAGSGRGFAARLVHALSSRGSITPVTVNAAALEPSEASHLFTKPDVGFLATAANAGTSLIIERADNLPPHVQALLADIVGVGTKPPDKLHLILTIDPRTDPTSSPLFRAILRIVDVPSFGARVEDAWCWFLAAGAETESMDVDRMTRLASTIRRTGWPAVTYAVPTPSIPIRADIDDEASAPSVYDTPRAFPPAFDAFTEAVREALRSFHDPSRLQTSALLSLKALQRNKEARLAVADLRALLRSGIDRLERELDRELLRASYLEVDAKQTVIADRLGFPYSTYRRHLAKAASLLADLLWQDDQRTE
jgi:hypothetical protein